MSVVCSRCGRDLQDGVLSCEFCGEVFKNQDDGVTKTQIEEKYVCKLCNSILEEGQAFCPNCGAKREEEKKKICARCNAELLEGQAFCPICGLSVKSMYQPVDTDNLILEEKSKKSKKSKKIAMVVIIIIAIICIFLAVVSSGSRTDFNDMYSNISGQLWCEIDENGEWIKLDTNPMDTEDDESDYYTDYYTFGKPCNEKIKEINIDLGFSTSLYEKMNSTSALQGVQSEENDNYKVTWTYHPDHGLEVMYEIKNK